MGRKRKIVAELLIILVFLLGINGCEDTPDREFVCINFLDVSQGDCILIQLPDHKTMLIDAGGKDQSQFVVDFIRSKDITKLDYIVIAHPDDDHIGGMRAVFENFELDRIYMTDQHTLTDAYINMAQYLVQNNIQLRKAEGGVVLEDSADLKIKFLTPSKAEGDDSSSAIIKVRYKDTRFLFLGDTGAEAEKQMLKNTEDIRADVIKIGQCGTAQAPTPEFIKQVMPRYAVISCGNRYDLPEQLTLDTLEQNQVQIYRTDIVGNIIMKTDGQNISIDTVKRADSYYARPPHESSPLLSSDPHNFSGESSQGGFQEEIVYITKTGTKFHRQGCPYLKYSTQAIDRKEAIMNGYGPCSLCFHDK